VRNLHTHGFLSGAYFLFSKQDLESSLRLFHTDSLLYVHRLSLPCDILDSLGIFEDLVFFFFFFL
jgi:hypothetical protein